MLHRRHLLAAPLLAALPAHAAPGWRHTVSELRVGAAGSGVAALATAMGGRLGVRVAGVRLQGGALVTALNEGHIEAALLDGATLSQARGLMLGRLTVLPGQVGGRTRVVRTALPAGMQRDLAAALA